MPTNLLFCLAAVLALSGCVPASRGETVIGPAESFMIPALDPDIRLHVRHVFANEGRQGHRPIVLFVHGSAFPCEPHFDIDLPGGSWMGFTASRGFDAYCVDIRGYGRSTRPAAMEQPPEANQPFADAREAVRDVAAAVDFILTRRGASTVHLVGWSWGAAVAAQYAAENPAKVERLVLYAPIWLIARAPVYQGAYRTVTHDSVRPIYIAGIPAPRVEEISPAAWYDHWWRRALDLDPQGASQTPPSVRVPNGAQRDLAEHWAKHAPTFDPGAIRASTLVVVGEWDALTPPGTAQEVFKRLTGARHRRLVVLPEATHFMSNERNRMNLMREAQDFLEEPQRWPGPVSQ